MPGQVEDDLSIRFGAGEVRTNLGLLARVRAANPDAFIIYKPHPDVVAGHRIGAVPDSEARRFADLVVSNGSTDRLLAVSHEVHTMTSLAGFEALLRGLRVVVYGRPFYAGWGLTTDLPPFDRGRRLSLDQLVAGALILYPRYLDPLTRLPCGPEILIERLERPELWRAGPLVRARRLQGLLSRRLGGCARSRRPAGDPRRAGIRRARSHSGRGPDAGAVPGRRDYRCVERSRRGAGRVLCRTGCRARAGGAQPRAAGADRGGLPRRRRSRRKRRDRCRRHRGDGGLARGDSTTPTRSIC